MKNFYFVKVNLNSKIYDVYEEKLKFDDVFNELVESFNPNKQYIVPVKKIYNNFGKNEYYKTNEIFTLKNIDKNKEKKTIFGDIVKTYNKLDVSKEKYMKIENSIEFYLDLTNEILVFSPVNEFRKEKILSSFESLLNQMITKYQFKLFFLVDVEAFFKKYSELSSINSITIETIPPNSLDSTLDRLENLYSGVRDNYESNVILQKATYESDNLNINSTFVKKNLKKCGAGYANMKVSGYDSENNKRKIDSKKYAITASFISITNSIHEIKNKIDQLKDWMK